MIGGYRGIPEPANDRGIRRMGAGAIENNAEGESLVEAEMPEDAHEGFLTEHGYASSTPAVDADAVYAFFGKSGVVAFDRAGNEMWRVAVGKESSSRRWGSAASLVLHGDLVIVNAAEESQSIRGLDRKTGREAWQAEAAALELAGGRIIVPSRWSGTFVLPAEPRYEIPAQNRFAGDESDFSGTPAIADGRLFLRSGRFRYCVGEDRAGGGR